MPEVRRRGLSDQIGVGADRTQRGAAQGGGIGPTIARLQQAVRGRVPAGQSRTAGALTVTDYEAAPVGASYNEGVVEVEGLYIVKAQATATALADTYVSIDLVGAGAGSERIDYRYHYVNADGSDIPIFASGTAWCNEGVTISSTVSGGTITAHSLTYTLIEAS